MAEKKEKKVNQSSEAEACENQASCESQTENLVGDKELESLKAQVEEYKDKWMRNVAEFDNYKKRNAKLWQDAFNEGVSSVILKILPIGDNLDWALTLGLDEKTAEGIKGIQKKYNEVLKSLDVEEINPLGKPFNPNEAEAVMQVEASEDEESDCVKQVFQKGYKKGEKIIRYATVSVIK